MHESIARLWAKTSEKDPASWHPLILHLIDVAVSADAILAREPTSTRQRMAAIFDLPWLDARSWILMLIACHDLGKACPGFQCKWPAFKPLLERTGLSVRRGVDTDINHAFVSQIAAESLLIGIGWPESLARLSADAIGCHHGTRASPLVLDRLIGNSRALGAEEWAMVRQQYFHELRDLFEADSEPAKVTLSGADFMLLSGLTSFADWIGSSEVWFPFGAVDDCQDLSRWRDSRRSNAERALDEIGWGARTPLSMESKPFSEVFGFAPRPLQTMLAQVVSEIEEPVVILIEAPMGEGKTEAAYYAFLELQRRFGHRGLYIALPTKATGNAMFERTLRFLAPYGRDRNLDLQLLHGSTLLNDSFQELRLSGIHDERQDGGIRAGEWFTNKKRALLSEYGVGTVDQAILPILPVRHQFVRMWGLANRVVIFDEIHAYDAYTGTLLLHTIRWLRALGSSIILLSATLPPSVRRGLSEIAGGTISKEETPYPRISVFGSRSRSLHFLADPARRRKLRIEGIPPDVARIREELTERLVRGGMALALLNTVQRAQDVYRAFPAGTLLARDGWTVGKRLADGTEVYLFHARFPADRRQAREDDAIERFGSGGERTGKKILIATQVAEQSLDLDFDFMITDLAPVDLLLQRAGRLWRHERSQRPLPHPCFMVAGLTGDTPPSFGGPLWWGSIYREDLLLQTWTALIGKNDLTLPDEIDSLVQAIYDGGVEIPDSIKERYDQALAAEGEAMAYVQQAHQAIIGLPDDSSWDQSDVFILRDEEDGAHKTLMAKTRLGDDSITVIPLFPADTFLSDQKPDMETSKAYYLRAVSLSRTGIVRKLRAAGIPEGWRNSALLRNCYALSLDEQDRSKIDSTLRLDEELGFVYETKEAE